MPTFDNALPIRGCDVFPGADTTFVTGGDTIAWCPLKFTREPILLGDEAFDPFVNPVRPVLPEMSLEI